MELFYRSFVIETHRLFSFPKHMPLPCYHSSLLLHTPATCSHTRSCTDDVWCCCDKTPPPVVHVVCSRVRRRNSCMSSETAASSPPGCAPHIHNTPLRARWLSPQVLSSINQTAFELINNKSISRRREMKVSWGRCLFVRQTSVAPSLSASELGVSFTLETWLAGYHKSKY